MGNIWSAEKLLGIPLAQGLIDKKNKQAYLDHAIVTARVIQKKFPRTQSIANTFRFEGNGEIEYYGTLYTGDRQFESSVFTIRNPIARVGTGDCFMAGLIYGIRNFQDPQKTIEFASSAASGKFFEKGDFTGQSVQKILRSMQSTGLS
jgi:2-dehydro-3-deoxygluconokinase